MFLIFKYTWRGFFLSRNCLFFYNNSSCLLSIILYVNNLVWLRNHFLLPSHTYYLPCRLDYCYFSSTCSENVKKISHFWEDEFCISIQPFIISIYNRLKYIFWNYHLRSSFSYVIYPSFRISKKLLK